MPNLVKCSLTGFKCKPSGRYSSVLDCVWLYNNLREAFQKKLWKSGQADRLGWPPPPLPRSGQENVKISRQVAIFGVILSFYKGQKWVKIFTNRSGQAEGGCPPLPPQSGQPDRFFTVFFLNPSLKTLIKIPSAAFVAKYPTWPSSKRLTNLLPVFDTPSTEVKLFWRKKGEQISLVQKYNRQTEHPTLRDG